jgi:hypothetical protein
MYNGFWGGLVTAVAGARRSRIHHLAESLVGRGVLIDITRHKGKESLDPGERITAADPDAALVQANFLKEFVWASTYPAARDWLALHVNSAETREGMTAFVEKRQPRYRELRKLRPNQKCKACGATGLAPDFKFCEISGKPLGS